MKFKVTVTRTDEYVIEVDETIWTPEEIKGWAKTFYPADDPEDIAKHLAGTIMYEGSGNGFMEGFGYVKTFRSDGSLKHQTGEGFKKLTEDQYTKGLSVTPLIENDDFEYEIEEIRQP